MTKLSLWDRIASAVFGALFGAIYGAIIALIVGWHSDGVWNVAYVKTTSLVFAILSFVIGPFIGDVIAGALHFLLALGAAELYVLPDHRLGLIWSLVLLGAGTFLAVLLVEQTW